MICAKKNVIFWTKGIDEMWEGCTRVGGIQVQMSFWAEIFRDNGWNVISFSRLKRKSIKGISFLYWPELRFIGIIIDLFYSLFLLMKYRPKVIICRGASRNLSYLSLYTKLLGNKLVYFAASNSDFEIGNELIDANHDRFLYRYGLKKVQYVISQNVEQMKMSQRNYKSNGLLIPNIWYSNNLISQKEERNSILWISNFRSLKRPEWFIRLAKNNPQISFIMAGGGTDKTLFEHCQKQALELPNLRFLGAVPFLKTMELFKSAKLFVCTSEIEGFPNTFLQAFFNKIPILTTFDPSNIIKTNKLGLCVPTENELNEKFAKIQDEFLYKMYKDNIESYFAANYDAKIQYCRLINYIIQVSQVKIKRSH